MKKVIIAVHGLGNKPSKETLKKWWKNALNEGLVNIDKGVKLPRFELIYWADIIYSEPLDESVEDKKNPLYFREKYTRSNDKNHSIAGKTRKKLQSLVEEAVENIFLNEDYSLNFSGLTDNLLKKYFSDLHLYYSINSTSLDGKVYKIRDLIRDRIKKIIKKYRNYDIFLVAHSMGSIIAFDVLKFLIPEIRINTFATIGSPLGLPVVLGKIAAENKIINKDISMKSPESVYNHWYNFSDPLDKIAFDFKLSDDFYPNKNNIKPFDFIVSNDYEIDGIRNPHKSYGYLRTAEFADILYQFITATEKKSSMYIFFKKLISKTRKRNE